MANNELQFSLPITLYSNYGYVEVDKNEFNSNKQLCAFRKGKQLYGVLNVIS